MKYTWSSNWFLADANIVGKELEELGDVEELSNKKVLEYATNHPESELYKCFEWDNEKASNNWRLRQATNILCSISIVIDDNAKPIEKTRVYVKTKDNSLEKKTFKKLVDVLENDEEYHKLLEDMKADLERTQDKYKKIIRLQDMKDIIFDMYKKL